MADLETRLRAFAHSDELFPATPDIAAAVSARLRDPAAPAVRAPRRLSRRTLAIALAALLLLPAAAIAAVPGTRHAVLDWLGLRHVTVERSTTQPALRPPTPSDLGDRVSLVEARSRVDFAILVPDALGDPTSVYVRSSPPGGRVVLVFDRIHVTELQGSDSRRYLFKMLGPDSKVERVRVDGKPGVWITGKPHGVMYADRNGQFRDDTFQLAGDTLLWERGGLVLRIEGARSKADALRIASSVAVGG